MPHDSTPIRVTKWGDHWRVVIGRGSGEGRRRVITLPLGSTADDADRIAAEVARSEASAGYLHTQARTVGDALAAFIAAKSSPSANLRPATIANYTRSAKTLTKAMGTILLASLRACDVARFVADRLTAGKAPRTAEADALTLRLALVACGHGRERTDELFKGIAYGETVPRRALTRDEIDALRRAISNATFRTIFELALQAGLRHGEILTRRWGDFDRHRATIMVANVPEIGFKTKNGKARCVALPADLVRTLSEEWMRRGRPVAHEWMVIGRYGERFAGIAANTLRMAAACKAAGISGRCIHELRHTYGSMLIEAGVDLLTVSRMMGHQSVATTEKVYVHVNASQFAAAAAKLDALFAPAKTFAKLHDARLQPLESLV